MNGKIWKVWFPHVTTRGRPGAIRSPISTDSYSSVYPWLEVDFRGTLISRLLLLLLLVLALSSRTDIDLSHSNRGRGMVMVSIRAVVSDDSILKKEFVLPGEIVSLVTSMASLPIIAIFFWQRLQQARFKTLSIASVTLLLVCGGLWHG